MAVIMTPPYMQFLDNEGNPLAGGKIYTYRAGTDTPKATFTDHTESTQHENPILLDNAGRAVVFISGSYKIVIKDAVDNVIRTIDNVTSFNVIASAAESYFESFSGNGSQTSFTLSRDVGTDEKAVMVFINKNLPQHCKNGSLAADTDWTKEAGWSIGAGVATATGTVSTAMYQNAITTLVQGQAYVLAYAMTRSAGSLTPSIGGNSGVARSADGTYKEIIIAGSSQQIKFTGTGFTGTFDDVSVTPVTGQGYDILSPSAFTLNGNSISFASAPADGTNNIFIFAPSLLVAAASASAASAEASADLAINSANIAVTSAASAQAWALQAGSISVPDNSITHAKIQKMAAYTAICNPTSATADTQAIPIAHFWPIGVPFPVFDQLTGSQPPSNGGTMKFIKLTAGQSGTGGFNEGLLSGESVSGSSPYMNATATIAQGPMSGQTVRLINTESRFIRAGASSGTLQDDELKSHTHDTSITGWSNNGATSFLLGGTDTPATKTFTSAATGGIETRPRNIQATYYMRVK